jgi:hypothetical protein
LRLRVKDTIYIKIKNKNSIFQLFFPLSCYWENASTLSLSHTLQMKGSTLRPLFFGLSISEVVFYFYDFKKDFEVGPLSICLLHFPIKAKCYATVYWFSLGKFQGQFGNKPCKMRSPKKNCGVIFLVEFVYFILQVSTSYSYLGGSIDPFLALNINSHLFIYL